MKKKELYRRYFVFTIALFISALGVSIITRSYLGTSPISSIPYVLSLNTPLSMGTYIFLLNMALIAGQMLMLGKSGIREKRVELFMQIPISVVFGLFIDLTMGMLSNYILPLYSLKILSLVIGCAVLALGICFEVVADVTMVSGEYFVQIASRRFKKEFGLVKIIFDISLVVIAALFSLLLAGHIEGLREGTVIAALLTGPFVRLISPCLDFIRRWESPEADMSRIIPVAGSGSQKVPAVITISREYGSGGHLIGEQLAGKLGIKFYDKELIRLVAQESGFSEEFISEKEQHMPSSLLYQMIMQDYEAPIEKSLSPDDALFVAQSRVIRRLVSEGSCVIVGRCGDYILRDVPGCIHVYLHADMPHKIERAVKEYGIDRKTAADEIERINKARETHYYHFTGRRWGDIHNYHLTCDTGMMEDNQVCDIIGALYKSKSAV